jgi:hypothetical protein
MIPVLGKKTVETTRFMGSTYKRVPTEGEHEGAARWQGKAFGNVDVELRRLTSRQWSASLEGYAFGADSKRSLEKVLVDWRAHAGKTPPLKFMGANFASKESNEWLGLVFGIPARVFRTDLMGGEKTWGATVGDQVFRATSVEKLEDAVTAAFQNDPRNPNAPKQRERSARQSSLVHADGILLSGHLLEDLVEDEATIRRIALRWRGVQHEITSAYMTSTEAALVPGIAALVSSCETTAKLFDALVDPLDSDDEERDL